MTGSSALRHAVQGLAQPVRLDRYLRDTFPQWGRKATGALINGGGVMINRRAVSLASWQVQNGDVITIASPPNTLLAGFSAFDPAWLLADAGALLAVNKPAGLLSEPTRWAQGVNLRDLAAAHYGCTLHLPHRLDRDTSGVVLLVRDAATARWLDAQFRAHTVTKEYMAIVYAPNRLAAAGEINAPLAPDKQRPERMQVVRAGGAWAKTRYSAEPPQGHRQVVHLWPLTGRTHQLRAHLAHMGAPILGDRIYGDAASAPRLLLHAVAIDLPPHADQGPQHYAAPIPQEIQDAERGNRGDISIA